MTDEPTVSSFTVKVPPNFEPERKPPRLTLSDDQLADLEPTLTASEVKVLTETASKVAYALGRKDAGEEIAAALERCEDDARRAERAEGIAGNRGTAKTWFDLAAGYMRSAELAREVASQPLSATSDTTSGVPRHPEVSEAVRSPQEPCGHPTCPCTSQENANG